MKKILLLILIAGAFSIYHFRLYEAEEFKSIFSKKSEQTERTISTEDEAISSVNTNIFIPKIEYDNNLRKATPTEVSECKDDPAICVVDLAVNCTINPDATQCDKTRLPRFIFFSDESFGRPTYITYKVRKTYPIDAYTVEIQTESDCDGMWFGLCKGNIIYVVSKDEKGWKVNDIYALETY